MKSISAVLATADKSRKLLQSVPWFTRDRVLDFLAHDEIEGESELDIFALVCQFRMFLPWVILGKDYIILPLRYERNIFPKLTRNNNVRCLGAWTVPQASLPSRCSQLPHHFAVDTLQFSPGC